MTALGIDSGFPPLRVGTPTQGKILPHSEDGGALDVSFSTVVIMLARLAPPSDAPSHVGLPSTLEGVAHGQPVEQDEDEAPEQAPGVILGAVSVPDTVDLDLDRIRGLDPRFVQRLRRVTERLAVEHDIRVDVLEGLRSRDRQMELFAQGRTAPGPVVTWTTNSLHLDGLAADVRLNGEAPAGPTAAILARVAREEGLRTLYPFDSGHIELPGVRSGGGSPEARMEPADAGRTLLPEPSRPNGIAVPAPVARPARPAQIARPGGLEARLEGLPVHELAPRGGDSPAKLAHSANPPLDSLSKVLVGPATESPSPETTALARGVAAPPPAGESDNEPPGKPTGAPPVSRGTPDKAAPSTEVASVSVAQGSDVPSAASSGLLAESAAGGPLRHAESLRRVVAVQEASALRPPPTQVLVSLEPGPNGGALRVGLRGGQVFAALSLPDEATVQRLARSVHELRRGLQQQGLDTGTIAVRLAQAAVAPEARVIVEPTSQRLGDPSDRDGRWDTNPQERRGRDRDDADGRHASERRPDRDRS